MVLNASIEVADQATNGGYEVSGLRADAYNVTVSMQGFNTREVRGVALRGGESARINVTLAVKTAAETVTVTNDAPLIATDSPPISATLDNFALLTMPRDSRDIYSFLYTNPNITQADSDGSFKFIGAQSYGASFSLDGQRSNGGVFGQPTASQPSLETVGELTVLSNNFTAEYAGIANVRVNTKRGGANYHGSLFYNSKNSAIAGAERRQAESGPHPSNPAFKIGFGLIGDRSCKSNALLQFHFFIDRIPNPGLQLL